MKILIKFKTGAYFYHVLDLSFYFIKRSLDLDLGVVYFIRFKFAKFLSKCK